MKPIIGILNNLKNEPNEGPYADVYKANKIYIDRISEANGIPLGIFKFEKELLDKCDGFLLIGGHRITENHYKVIEYAIKHNKPLLGICNGMQAIVMYDYLWQECKKSRLKPTVPNLYKKYDELKEQKITILKKLEHHGSELSQRRVELTPENINRYRHHINILSGSILEKIYNTKAINVASINTYGVYQVPASLEIIAKSNDGVVEAIKYKDKPIIGIQFHAELDENIAIFEELIKKSSAR